MRGAYNYRLLLIPYLIRPHNNVAERNKIKTRSKLDSIYKPSVRFVFILNQQWPYPGYMVMKYMRFLWRYFTLVTHIHLRQIGLTIQVRYMHNSNKAKNLSNFFLPFCIKVAVPWNSFDVQRSGTRIGQTKFQWNLVFKHKYVCRKSKHNLNKLLKVINHIILLLDVSDFLYSSNLW